MKKIIFITKSVFNILVIIGFLCLIVKLIMEVLE